MQFARINGIVMHYQLIGAPAGKPVIVFANSLGTDFRIWRDVIVRLAGEYAIVVYDKRGHGLSELGDAPHRIETHAADIAALLDHLSVTSAVVCGLSIGGLIAQGLYASRPDLIQSIIFCDTAHKIGTEASWNGRIAAAEQNGIASFADTVMKMWFTPDFHAKRAEDLVGYRTMLTRQPVAGYTAACTAIREADLTETAKNIAVPSLVVVGDQDGSTPPELVRSFADLVPNARYEIIKDAAHIPCVEQPETLAALIRDFIGKSGGAAHG